MQPMRWQWQSLMRIIWLRPEQHKTDWPELVEGLSCFKVKDGPSTGSGQTVVGHLA
jgi:hypothetical protein